MQPTYCACTIYRLVISLTIFGELLVSKRYRILMLQIFSGFCNTTELFQLHQPSNNISIMLKMMDLYHLDKDQLQTTGQCFVQFHLSQLTKLGDGSRSSSLLTTVKYCSLISSTASKTKIIEQVLLFFQLTYLKTCIPTPTVAAYVKIIFLFP